jgi:hypothetical protein
VAYNVSRSECVASFFSQEVSHLNNIGYFITARILPVRVSDRSVFQSTCNRLIAHSEPDGTRRRTGGEVKGKDANGVGNQQPCTVGPKPLLPTIKTSDKLASSTASRELRSKIRQFLHRCFHITFNCC